MNSDWVALLQATTALVDAVASVLGVLIWPALIVLVAVRFRDKFIAILEAMRDRIEAGAEFQVGAGGFSFGQAPQLPDVESPEQADKAAPAEDELEPPSKGGQFAYVAPPEGHLEGAKRLELVHASRPKGIKNGRAYYSVRVALRAVDENVLDEVERVVYYLHPTFRNRVKTVKDPGRNFELRFSAWGEFTISAEVYLRGQDEPVKLSRYLNL